MPTSSTRFRGSWAEKPPLRAMFILCSEDHFGAGLIAHCDAAIVLQTPGGAAATSEPEARATIEYAVLHARVRRVVVLAHRACRPAGGALLDGAREQARAQWQALRNDGFSQQLFQAHGIDVRMLWVDATSGEVSDWHADQQRLVPMERGDVERLLASLEEPTS